MDPDETADNSHGSGGRRRRRDNNNSRSIGSGVGLKGDSSNEIHKEQPRNDSSVAVDDRPSYLQYLVHGNDSGSNDDGGENDGGDGSREQLNISSRSPLCTTVAKGTPPPSKINNTRSRSASRRKSSLTKINDNDNNNNMVSLSATAVANEDGRRRGRRRNEEEEGIQGVPHKKENMRSSRLKSSSKLNNSNTNNNTNNKHTDTVD